MSLFQRATDLAGAVAKDRAEAAARQALRKGMALLAVGIFLVLFLVFGAVAGFAALQSLVGTVYAALIVSGASLLLALIFLAMARSRSHRRRHSVQVRAELDALRRDAEEELRKASPLLVAGAFLSGFVFGRKD